MAAFGPTTRSRNAAANSASRLIAVSTLANVATALWSVRPPTPQKVSRRSSRRLPVSGMCCGPFCESSASMTSATLPFHRR